MRGCFEDLATKNTKITKEQADQIPRFPNYEIGKGEGRFARRTAKGEAED